MDYSDSKQEEYPFPDESHLDLVDAAQHEEVVEEIQALVSRVAKAGLSRPWLDSLKAMVSKNTDVFHVGFSPGPPAQFTPVTIELVPEANPVRSHFRNYTQELRYSFCQRLSRHYSNAT